MQREKFFALQFSVPRVPDRVDGRTFSPVEEKVKHG